MIRPPVPMRLLVHRIGTLVLGMGPDALQGLRAFHQLASVGATKRSEQSAASIRADTVGGY